MTIINTYASVKNCDYNSTKIADIGFANTSASTSKVEAENDDVQDNVINAAACSSGK